MTKLQQLIEAAKAVTHSTARTRARKDNCEPYKSDWNARRLRRADLRLCRKSALARRRFNGFALAARWIGSRKIARATG